MVHTVDMVVISVVNGDITRQKVDAVVNAASPQMRGGGGVDGAIHRAAGPELLRECIERFPHGLTTGEAVWTQAYRLDARYIIHTPGPNYGAGQTDPQLLRSSYGNSLKVADILRVRSIAFPLISAGVYRWPLEDAMRIAVDVLTHADTRVEDIRIVVLSDDYANRLRLLI